MSKRISGYSWRIRSICGNVTVRMPMPGNPAEFMNYAAREGQRELTDYLKRNPECESIALHVVALYDDGSEAE